MPPIVRGSVYWCNYCPIVGGELSSHRPALIISHTKLNNGMSGAITIPMSSKTPPDQHIRNHVFVESARSWASVRQIKSARQLELGDKIGEATPEELERVLEVLTSRFLNPRYVQGAVRTPSGHRRIEPGTVWDVKFYDQDGDVQNEHTLILDYNHGNGIAITANVEYLEKPESRVRVPISMVGSSNPASALIHRIRSIDTVARPMTMMNRVDEDSLMSVKLRLLSAVGA